MMARVQRSAQHARSMRRKLQRICALNVGTGAMMKNNAARYARRVGCAQNWRVKVGGYAASIARTQGVTPLLRLRRWPTA